MALQQLHKLLEAQLFARGRGAPLCRALSTTVHVAVEVLGHAQDILEWVEDEHIAMYGRGAAS